MKSHHASWREYMKKLLTVAEAAEALSLKVSTIRAWLLRRRLPFVRCGRSIRVPSEAVESFIEKHTVLAKESGDE
jgi:excisionase family DNA binding protein